MRTMDDYDLQKRNERIEDQYDDMKHRLVLEVIGDDYDAVCTNVMGVLVLPSEIEDVLVALAMLQLHESALMAKLPKMINCAAQLAEWLNTDIEYSFDNRTLTVAPKDVIDI